jgi:hypothetical protein
MKNKTPWKCALLLSGMGLLSSAMAVTSSADARPRPEDFASYSQFLQALFDYQHQQNAANSSFSSAPATTTDNSSTESLDDAVAKANAGENPGYVDNSAHPRSTFKSFTLSQLPSQDMSQTAVDQALGIFGEHTLKQAPTTVARLREGNELNLTPDVPLRLISDAYDISMLEVGEQSNTFSADIILPEGQGRATATSRKNADGSIDITLDSSVRTNLYIVDRDGMPGTAFSHAGAVALRSLALDIKGLNAHISGARTTGSNNNDLLVVRTTTPNAIHIDFSGTRIGVADARYDGGTLRLSSSTIGPVNYFMRFGNDAVLTIAPGLDLTTVISRPDGMNKPLITLNGFLGDINLSNISLMEDGTDQSAGTPTLTIGKLGLTNLSMNNMHIYLVDRSIVLDAGGGMRNVGMSLERVSMGTNPNIMVGDFYVQNMNIVNSRITIAAH